MTKKPLFLGLDLSTQQLKGVVLDDQLETVVLEKVEFDTDLPRFGTKKGVFVNGDEILAPVAMWLAAIDLLMERLSSHKNILENLVGISGACQQHGSVYWNGQAEESLENLNPNATLQDSLSTALSWKMSPNWQDHSTGLECEAFEKAVGGPDKLAEITGSKAHYRFTGPQILKLKRTNPEAYKETRHISLVSSFLASVLAGKLVPLDVADACGTNLWNIQTRKWEPELLNLIDSEVEKKLGSVEIDGSASFTISPYFVGKYDISPHCKVILCTGDNPGTIMALPLKTNDVMISLGTSTTALIITEKYKPDLSFHTFSHPAGNGFMGMLCYCNGALAREQIRDGINAQLGTGDDLWANFDETVLAGAALGKKSSVAAKLGFYFPLGEIIPDVPAQIKRFVVNSDDSVIEISAIPNDQWTLFDDALAIIESQALSIRSRLQPMLTTSTKCPRRIFFVGGGSRNNAICNIMARVLTPEENSFQLQLSDACGKGAAHKAAWSIIGQGEIWEEFIEQRWKLNQAIKLEMDTNSPETRSEYEAIVPVFESCELRLLGVRV